MVDSQSNCSPLILMKFHRHRTHTSWVRKTLLWTFPSLTNNWNTDPNRYTLITSLVKSTNLIKFTITELRDCSRAFGTIFCRGLWACLPVPSGCGICGYVRYASTHHNSFYDSYFSSFINTWGFSDHPVKVNHLDSVFV